MNTQRQAAPTGTTSNDRAVGRLVDRIEVHGDGRLAVLPLLVKLGIGLPAFFAVVFAANGQWPLTTTAVVAVAMALVAAWLLRRGRAGLATPALLSALTGPLVVAIWQTGGVAGPLSPWLAFVGLVAVLTLGARAAAAWLSATIAAVVAIYAWEVLVRRLPSHVPLDVNRLIGLLTVVLLAGTLAGVILVYRRRHETLVAEVHAQATELRRSLAEIGELHGLLPICMHCKAVRVGDADSEVWERIDGYIARHADVQFSHGLCADCERKHYPDV